MSRLVVYAASLPIMAELAARLLPTFLVTRAPRPPKLARLHAAKQITASLMPFPALFDDKILPRIMKVVQVSPAFFGADGVVGGGERYPLELAKALAALTPTTLISFARQPRRFRDGELDVRLYRPMGVRAGQGDQSL